MEYSQDIASIERLAVALRIEASIQWLTKLDRRELMWLLSRVSIDTLAAPSLQARHGFLLKDTMLFGGAAAVKKALVLITLLLLMQHFR